jgi:hypothetical protein
VNILSGTVNYKLRSNLLSTVGAAYTTVDFKEPGFSDLTSYTGTIGLTYIQSERDTFSAGARYTKFDSNPGSSSTVQEYALGVIHKFTPTFTVGATGGVSLTKVQGTSGTGVEFAGGIDLTKLFSQGDATLSYRQGVTRGSGIYGGETLRTQTVSLRVSRPFGNDLTGTATAAYSNYRSIKTSDVNVDEIALGASVSYRLSRWFDLALAYHYVNSKDNVVSSRDYFNNIVLLTLRVSYSRQP